MGWPLRTQPLHLTTGFCNLWCFQPPSVKALSYRLGFHTQLPFLLTTLIPFILEGKTAPLGIALLCFIYENSTGCFCRQPISLYKEKANRFAMLASCLARNCGSDYKMPVHFCKMSTLSPNQKQFLFQLGFRIMKSIQHKSTELLNGLRRPRQLIYFHLSQISPGPTGL